MTMTEDQQYCVDMLAEWAGGPHHLPRAYEFGAGVCINWHGNLSTYDFDRLTHLVVIAHKRAVRIEIGPSGPGMVKIIAHRRKPMKVGTGQHQWQCHPTLAMLAARIRDMQDVESGRWPLSDATG